MQEFVEILTNGLLIEIGTSREMYDVHIHILIGDSPARGKITYSHQFNGAYGCFTCMNSGLKIGKKARIYQYKRQVQLCSAALYKKQVKKIEVL